MCMIIWYVKITSVQITFSYQPILYYFIVLLHFRKHTVLHGKISTLQIIVREDPKLEMLLVLTTIALLTAAFREKQIQFFEKTGIKIL